MFKLNVTIPDIFDDDKRPWLCVNTVALSYGGATGALYRVE